MIFQSSQGIIYGGLTLKIRGATLENFDCQIPILWQCTKLKRFSFSPYTVDLVIFACLDCREFVIFGTLYDEF